MSSTVALDLFYAVRAGTGRSSRDHCEDGYQELLVPTMTTIKPAYRWAIRVRDYILQMYIHVPTFLQLMAAIVLLLLQILVWIQLICHKSI